MTERLELETAWNLLVDPSEPWRLRPTSRELARATLRCPGKARHLLAHSFVTPHGVLIAMVVRPAPINVTTTLRGAAVRTWSPQQRPSTTGWFVLWATDWSEREDAPLCACTCRRSWALDVGWFARQVGDVLASDMPNPTSDA